MSLSGLTRTSQGRSSHIPDVHLSGSIPISSSCTMHIDQGSHAEDHHHHDREVQESPETRRPGQSQVAISKSGRL